MSDDVLEVNGRPYYVKVSTNDHPLGKSFHYHSHNHEDGTQGTIAHHHCDVRCQRLTAILTPTDPLPVRREAEYH